MPPPDADFAFKIDFAKGEGDPRRVFDAASSLIDGFELLDEAVATSVDSKLKPVLILEDMEAGSLKVWLKNLLNRIPDESIKGLEWKKAVGHYLLKAKYAAVEFLDDENAGRSGFDLLREELRDLAAQTDVRHLPDYAPIHEGRLLASLEQIQNAKRTLGPKDRLIIETDERTYEVDLSKTWDPSQVIHVENLKETHSEGEIILTIRKPDLLGEAQWQFSHGKTTLSAPVKDEEWLQQLHARKIALYSGDALRCRVRFTYIYDEQGALIDQKTEIMKVIEVLPGPGSQLGFDLPPA